MTISFQLESWADYHRDCQALWREHYEEIAVQKDRMPMNPDVRSYEALESIGALRILTARDEGGMVGYLITVVRPHMHYADVLCGFEDAYFLSARHRRGMTGVRLIREGVDRLRAEGVRKAFFHTKAFKDLGRIYERLGFSRSDVVYSQWIGD